MVERLGILKEEQKKFFESIKSKSDLTWYMLSKFCGVSDKTLRDWAKAKFTASYKVCDFLSKNFSVSLPSNYKILKPYWYITSEFCRKGAIARQKRHGLLGDIESRRRGGLNSQMMREKNPEKYRRLGCIVRKRFRVFKPSLKLAELCGILLGDGGITDNQVRVTLNKKDDKEYADFVASLMQKIIGEYPSITSRQNTLELTISGKVLTERLEEVGLKRGNKVEQQVDIPKWIFKNKKYAKVCLRGLMDTDGGVYLHHHTTQGNKYVNFGLCFTNASYPILKGVENILEKYKFSPSIVNGRRIYIYNFEEIKRYFKVIGSSNAKHINRFNSYLRLYKK